MMQFEVGDEDIKHNYEGDSNNILVDQTLYSKARLQFVRKVYSILSIQLFVTVMTTLASMYNTAFRNFQLNQTWVIYPMIALLIVSEIGIFCTKSGRKAPGSYVFLTMFTLAESYLVSLVCAAVGEQESKEIVLTAAVMTLGIVLAATGYAMFAREDFTMKMGILSVVAFAMLQFAIFGLFWPMGSFAYTLYCSIGVILFGIYLIVDTQLILGGRRHQLSLDEHAAAAMMLYIDIIQIFLYILKLLSKND